MEQLLREGEQLYGEGKTTEAEALFTRIVASDPRAKQALNNLGVIAFERSDLAQAADWFAQSLAVDPAYQEAIENIVALSQKLTPEQLASNTRLLGAYLRARLAMRQWGEHEANLLAKGKETLTQDARWSLIELTLTQTPTRVELLLTLLDGCGQLSDDRFTRFGVWLEEAELPRAVRDRLEWIMAGHTTSVELVRRWAHRETPRDPNPRPVDIDLGVRKRTRPIRPDDPFMKEVPSDAPSKEGGLRILVISDFNIAGQLTRLFRTLNRYTNHAARCVIFQDDYLQYDSDVLMRESDGRERAGALEEVRALIDRADFFHFGRGLFAIPGVDWNRYLSSTNCVFQYFGSELRNNGPAIEEFHRKTGFEALTAVDWTMVKRLRRSFYDLQAYFLNIDAMPRATMDFTNGIRICHAPSGKNYRDIKRSDQIEEILDRIARKYSNVELVRIEGMKNDECLKLKATCHMHFVSLWQSYGNNTTESAAMGVVPIVQLANFSRYLFPDTPVVHATADDAFEKIADLIEHPDKLRARSEACRAWTRRHFDAPVLIQKYWYLYDMIYHGLSVEYPDPLGSIFPSGI